MQIALLSNRHRLLGLFTTAMLVLFLIFLPRYIDISMDFFYLLCLTGFVALVPNLRDFRQIQFQDKAFLLIIVLNFLWIWFCYYINGEPEGGSGMLRNRQAHVLFLIPLYFLFRRYPIRMDILLLALFTSSVVTTGDIMLDLYAGVDHRFKGMNPNAFGPIQLCVAGMLFLSFWFLSGKLKMLSLLGFSLSIVTVILSGSRGTWLAGLFASIFLLFYLTHHWSVLKKVTALAAVVALCSLIYFVPVVKDRIDLGIEQTQAYVTTENVDDTFRHSSPSHRYEMWRGAWKMFMENPVTGVGVGGFRLHLADFGINVFAFPHPHNQYLTALATRGFPGLLFVLAILVIPISIARSRKSSDSDSQISNGSLILISIIFAINNLTADHFEHKPTILFFVAMMALHLARKSTNPIAD